MIFPKTIEVTLQSPVSNNFRCKMACDALDIDVKKKSIHHLRVEGVSIPEKWNVALVYGASGSGKTSMITNLFGNDIFKAVIDPEKPIINQLPEQYTYDECAAILSGIGLNSVPCWVRPVKTLSNGQRARAEAALLMTQSDDVIFIDEWTSVVDRTVAKAMSHCLQKFARKHNKKIILLSCHYDVLEWLIPDWLIDCNEQKFHLKQNENFFFTQREQIEFAVKEVGRGSWKYFSKYHYLSERLPGGEIYTYGLFVEGKQVGFNCFANYVPTLKGKQKMYHFNRLVVHPDYNGIGIGIKFLNATCDIFKKRKPTSKILGKFSSIPTLRSLVKSKEWKYLQTKRLMGKMQHGTNMERTGGFREGGIKTFHFEYIGRKDVKI